MKYLVSIPNKGNPRIGYVPQRRPIDGDMNIDAIELVKLGLNGTKWGLRTHDKKAKVMKKMHL